jgi:UTP--glucose-1-phosphate uridylyltransferase
MTNRVTKAVFPVAGMGTRFLPATKASPKEMLPVVDKPLIQYAAEEAIEAGIDTLIFVTGRHKRAIADHFDKAYELEHQLEMKKKDKMLEEIRSIIPKGINVVHTRQAEALGLGHAVLCSKPIVGDEPFAVILADDLVYDQNAHTIEQMQPIFSEYGHSILATETVPRDQTNQYGIVSTVPMGDRIGELKGIVEKPDPADAPSDQAVIGRYILTPRIYHHLENLKPGAGGELQLTDAIAALMAEEKVMSYNFRGKRYDCGSKLGYLEANVEYGLRHKELSADFRAYLKTLDI